MFITDRTAHSPAEYRVRDRDPGEVDLVVLHQTGPVFVADKVRTHFLIEPDGEVLQLHPPLTRLLYGSSAWNQRCITIEHAGHYPGRYTARGLPMWARWNEKATPACPVRARLDDHPTQVQASRALLLHLRETLPGLRFIGAHRQVQAGKAGCPGPDLWRETGEWAIRELGLELVATHPKGKDLPDAWRQTPRITCAEPSPFAAQPLRDPAGGPAADRVHTRSGS